MAVIQYISQTYSRCMSVRLLQHKPIFFIIPLVSNNKIYLEFQIETSPHTRTFQSKCRFLNIVCKSYFCSLWKTKHLYYKTRELRI